MNTPVSIEPPRALSRPRALVAAALAFLLVVAGAVTAPAASALDGAAVSGTVTSASTTGISVSVDGSGFGDVSAAYVAVIEKGAEAALSQSDPSIEAHLTDGAFTGTLSRAASALDRTKTYEIIAWQTRSFPSAATIYARADLAISSGQWAAVFPPSATTTTLTASPGTAEAGVAVTLTATVAPAAAGSVQFFDGATSLGSAAAAGSTASLVTSALAVGPHSLTATFTPTDAATHTGSTSAAVAYTITAAPTTPPATPTVTVTKTSGLSRDGETVTVRGTGFVPNPPATSGTRNPLPGVFGGAYVVFGKFLDTWKPSAGATSAARKVIVQKYGVLEGDLAKIGGAAAGGVVIGVDGTFETTITVSATEANDLLAGNYGIYTYPGSGATYAPFETFTPLTFAPPAPTVTVSKTVGLARGGEVITVTGTGFTPAPPATTGTRQPLPGVFGGAYVTFGKFLDTWRPSAGAPTSARTVITQKWGVAAAQFGGVVNAGNGGFVIAADGTFSIDLEVSASEANDLRAGNYGIYTYPGSGATYAPFETYTPIAFAAPVPEPAITVTVPDVTATAATARIVGAHFDVTGAYAAVIEKGTEADVTAGGGFVAMSYWRPGTIVGGSFDQTLALPAAGLDPEKQYEVIVWQQHTLPDSLTIFARADVTFTPEQFAILFPSTQPETPTEPVTPVDPFVPVSGGSLKWAISTSFSNYVTGPIAHGAIAVSGGATRANGVFQFGQSTAGTYDSATGIGTVGYGGAVRFTGHAGLLDVTIANPQVRITSASTAALYVTSGGAQVNFATLNLAAGGRTVSGGTVTYSGVPATLTSAGRDQVLGGFSTSLDPVTFTIGSPAAAPSGSTGTIAVAAASAKTASIPSTPPATTGIDAPAEQLAALGAGLPATVSAAGFEPNEQGIRVVVYSTPIVLGTVDADATGTVTWTGSVPATLADGEHTLTFQGSVARGIPFTLARAATTTEGCVVEAASLRWGFKESFRVYIEGIAAGGWELTDVVYEYPEYVWTSGTGAVDAEARAGLVTYGGGIRFTGHDGALDTTLANARVELAGDVGYLVFDVTGTTQAGESVTATGVRFAEFALPDLELTSDGIVLDALPATLTEAGSAAFGTYAAGEELDPVSAVLPVEAECGAAAPAAAAEAVAAEPTSEEAASESEAAPIWPWALGGIAVALAIGAVVWVVVARRRAAASTPGDSPDAE